MTSLATASPTVGLPRFGGRQIVLWVAAAAVVLTAHVVIAYAVQDLRPAEMDGGPPPAQMIELSPMMITPAEEADVSDVVTPDPVEEIETAEAKPVTEPEPPAETAEPVAGPPVEQAEPVQTAAVDATEATQPPMPERVDQPPLEEVVPDIVETVAPDVVIPLPQPKPVEAPVEAEVKKPVEPKVKTPVKVKKQAEARKPVEKARQPSKKEKAAPSRRKTASVTGKSAPRVAAPKSAKVASASRGDSSKWNSKLTSWLNRHKRYPRAAKARRAEGTVRVSFTVATSGRVTSVRIIGSSGDSDLDRSVLDMLQGAAVPAPPEGANPRVNVPLRFSLQ